MTLHRRNWLYSELQIIKRQVDNLPSDMSTEDALQRLSSDCYILGAVCAEVYSHLPRSLQKSRIGKLLSDREDSVCEIGRLLRGCCGEPSPEKMTAEAKSIDFTVM